MSRGWEKLQTPVHCSAGHVESLRQSLPQRHSDCAGQNSCQPSAQSVYCEHAQTKLRECEPWKRSHREGEIGSRRPPRRSRVSLPVHSGDRDGLGVVARFLGRTRPGVPHRRLLVARYADDVVLLAMSIAALQTMLLEVEQAFAAVGLTLNLGKTNFTSTLACEGSTLELSGHVVKWSPRLTFLGTVITLCGNDDEALRARMTRALRASQNWSPLLTNKKIAVAARVAAFLTSVMSSFCWQAQNWTPTKKQFNYIGSWFARLGIHDQSQKMPRGTHGFVVETSPQRRQEILDKTPRRRNQHG